MAEHSITFIGGGNIAASLIGGLISDGYNPEKIQVADPDSERRAWISERFGIAAHEDNATAVSDCEVVVLAVKPQQLPDVVSSIAPTLSTLPNDQRPLIVSVAAGIRTTSIQSWLGFDAAIIRAMPNTPALVSTGATGLYANANSSDTQHEIAESIMRAVGVTCWVDKEAQMDTVTALSGSGPAYFFLIMEALAAAGTGLGLPPETAQLLTLQTALGAARMAMESQDDPATLRARVTSPGGTTERAVAMFEEGELARLVDKALTAARDRSVELSRVLDES